MVKLRHWLTFGNNISNIYFGIGDPYLTHESNIVNMGYAAGNGPNNSQMIDFFPSNYFCYFIFKS